MEVVVVVVLQVMVATVILVGEFRMGEGVWCVAKSGASDKALQAGLDYACAAGADCGPIQETGLCFLPNTLQAHASYAFNSFYQRNHMSASSCDFSGSATLAKTDPSYGSCVYPASSRTAGSITSTTTGGRSPTTNPYPYGTGTGTGLDPNSMGPPITTTNNSTAPHRSSSSSSLATLLLEILLLSITVC